MAFETFNLLIARGRINTIASETNFITHTYTSDIDTIATITTSGYFPALLGSNAENVKVGDQISLQGSDDNEVFQLTTLNPIAMIPAFEGQTETSLTLANTWSGVFSSPVATTFTFKKLGSLVVAHFLDVDSVGDTVQTMNSTVAIPVAFRPSSLGEHSTPIIVKDAGPFKNGTMTVINTTGFITVYPTFPGTTFVGSGTTGFIDFYTSWFTD